MQTSSAHQVLHHSFSYCTAVLRASVRKFCSAGHFCRFFLRPVCPQTVKKRTSSVCKTVNIDCVFRRGEPFWSPIRSGAPERSLPSVCKTVKKDCMFRRGGNNLNRFGLRVFRLYYPIERFRLRILRRSKTPEIQCRFDRMKTPKRFTTGGK